MPTQPRSVLHPVLNTAWSVAMISLPLAPAAALAAQPAVRPGAASTVYKCSSAGTGVVYQDAPCAPGTELRNFATDPPTLSVVPGSTGAAAQPAPAPGSRAEHGPIPVRTREQPANVGDRRYIRVGMTQAEVVARIGKPDIDARGQRGKGQRWSYLPRGGDPNTITTVTLVDGRVADVERKVVR
jgi:hypothetical protein